MKRLMMIFTLALIAVVAAACGGGDDDNGGGGGDPAGVAEDFFIASFEGDVDRARELICEQYRDTITDAPDLGAAEEADITFDLDFETVSEEGDNATVRAAGTVSVSMEGLEEPMEMNLADLAGEEEMTLQLVREDGDWRVCDPTMGTTP